MYLDSMNKNECCGCTSCANICPKEAIAMFPDDRGFLFPQINMDKCINCGLCRKACDFCESLEKQQTVRTAYGVKHKNIAVRKKCRSGGAFYAIAEQVLKNDGFVWGAAFDENLSVRHICVSTIDELKRLQGSKYVQSYLEDCFATIGKQLRSGENVLFSGTACQVAGLKQYIFCRKINDEKLLTCDIVCQGVPSPKLYEEFKLYLETKYNDKLVDFNFRDKSRIGWSGHEESFVLEGRSKRKFSRNYVNYYYNYYMRNSCFACKYAGLNRPADFTLADFWGVKENYPEFADSVGNSLVLVNSEKAEKFLGKMKDNIEIIPAEIEKCLQPRLMSPSKMPEGYEVFWKEYKEKGFTYCIEKYGKESFKSKLVYLIKPFMRRVLHR